MLLLCVLGFKYTTFEFSTNIVNNLTMSTLFNILSDQSRLGISKTKVLKNDH